MYTNHKYTNHTNTSSQVVESQTATPSGQGAGVCGVLCPPQAHTNTSSGESLGILTKCASSIDFKGLREVAARRAEKFALQDESERLLPDERVRFCLKHRITKDENVTVRYNESRNKAHYSNVQRCGSVWICPVCAAQISEGRRQELKDGIDKWTKEGGSVYLLTLTNPHHHGDNLDRLLAGQKKALKYFWSDRKPKEMLQALNKVGHVTATEVTHGVNGWHPHYHILLFFKGQINHKALRSFLATQWQHCCKKAGLKVPSIEHGCDLRDGTYAQQYVSKWGLEDEMTKGHTKKGREGSATPWDLLRQSEDGCERSGRLFQQYAGSFKGKRQLHWSRGLKALLLVDDTTDEQLAAETDKDSVEVKQIALEIWRLIKRFKARADFLKAIEMDVIDGESRADSLIMTLAQRHVKENIHELMKDADLHHVRAEALKQRNSETV
jgi:hypothetical protein